MFTYRLALLKALGINYESLSEHMVLRGKHYQRGPSFTKQEYLKANEYCLMRNIQGFTCILVDSFNEFTVWLHAPNLDSAETIEIDESEAVASHQPSSQQTSESKFQLTYRGVKYSVKQDVSKPDVDNSFVQPDQSPVQPNSDPPPQKIYRGVVINS